VEKPGRSLVVDASLNAPRIAAELRRRGRAARSVNELGLHRVKDRELLEHLWLDVSDDPVLITADDKMPLMHRAIIERFGATIATVEPWSRHPDLIESPIPNEISNQEAYEREVVHRWAHSMQVQESGSIRRYYVSTHRAWTPRIPRFG
jgi:hypothetical protein